jgi:protein dithiol oxidoreductase (disulfide-forming)
MKYRALLTMLLVLPLLAACGGKNDGSENVAAPAAESAPAAEIAPAPATETAAVPAAAGEAPAAEAAADTAAPAAPAPVVPPEGPAPVPGKDYVEIPNGQPYAPLNGKIEVVEVFGYVCPACARFAPDVAAWKKKLPADVRLSYVPVAFGPTWAPYAKAFYAAESKGLVDKTHDAVFTKIHLERSLPGEGQAPDPAKVAAFYAGYGVDEKEFLALMNSFGVDAQVNRAKQFAMKSGVEGTPTIVVNGKYRVTGGNSYADVLRIADHLIAMERAAQ